MRIFNEPKTPSKYLGPAMPSQQGILMVVVLHSLSKGGLQLGLKSLRLRRRKGMPDFRRDS